MTRKQDLYCNPEGEWNGNEDDVNSGSGGVFLDSNSVAWCKVEVDFVARKRKQDLDCKYLGDVSDDGS